MKYFNVPQINKSITRIREGNITHEHRTGTAALNLLRNYFPLHSFGITAEQIQTVTDKRPDFAIEKYIPRSDSYKPHCFVEVKSLINSNFDKIVEQLHLTLFVSLADYADLTGDYSTFMIGIKGTKIAFYVYHHFSSLLHENGVFNVDGFIPLNYQIPRLEYMRYHDRFPLKVPSYNRYVANLNFTTDANDLSQMGAESSGKVPHPHILDLLNIQHREDIHNMFQYVCEKDPNFIFAG